MSAKAWVDCPDCEGAGRNTIDVWDGGATTDVRTERCETCIAHLEAVDEAVGAALDDARNRVMEIAGAPPAEWRHNPEMSAALNHLSGWQAAMGEVLEIIHAIRHPQGQPQGGKE